MCLKPKERRYIVFSKARSNLNQICQLHIPVALINNGLKGRDRRQNNRLLTYVPIRLLLGLRSMLK